MGVPVFDIFSGRFGDTNVSWLEAVEGLGNAAERMKQLAAEKPGPYFVFSAEKWTVMAAIDNSAGRNSSGKHDDEIKAG